MKAVIAVKSIARAKQRLSTVLPAAERARLMSLMVEDVLSALVASDSVSGVVVVTSDSAVKKLATGFGAMVLAEASDTQGPGSTALNAAFAQGIQAVEDMGVSDVLLLPADIPLVTPDAIDAMRRCHQRPGISLNPAASDGGTNALMLSPLRAIVTAFGHNSCRRHIELAEQAGSSPTLFQHPAFALDIDTIADLRALAALPVTCRTREYLEKSGVVARIQETPVIPGRQTG